MTISEMAKALVKHGYRVPDGDIHASCSLMDLRKSTRKKQTELAEFRLNMKEKGLYRGGVGTGSSGWEYQDMQYHGGMFASGEW